MRSGSDKAVFPELFSFLPFDLPYVSRLIIFTEKITNTREMIRKSPFLLLFALQLGSCNSTQQDPLAWHKQALAIATPESAGFSAGRLQRIDSVFQKFVEQHRINGVPTRTSSLKEEIQKIASVPGSLYWIDPAEDLTALLVIQTEGNYADLRNKFIATLYQALD